MKSIVVKALSFLTGASRSVLEFILPILKDQSAKLLADILPIALEIVTSLLTSNKSNEEKRNAAFQRINTIARQRGIQAASSTINLAIELAVTKIKQG
jgi:flagellar basal body L-ring protein FlgH